jgi:hypothetical protein
METAPVLARLTEQEQLENEVRVNYAQYRLAIEGSPGRNKYGEAADPLARTFERRMNSALHGILDIMHFGEEEVLDHVEVGQE